MNSTVLLVAENSLFLQNLSSSLRHFKASIITAGSKHEALEVCSNRKVDLALLDIRERSNDAMQILARLKKNQPETEVILLSDTQHIAQAMEGMQQGASDDISVPFDINLFRNKIKSALRRHRARRKRTLLNIFGDAMVAATFAESGEHEIAKEIYKNRSAVNFAAKKTEGGQIKQASGLDEPVR